MRTSGSHGMPKEPKEQLPESFVRLGVSTNRAGVLVPGIWYPHHPPSLGGDIIYMASTYTVVDTY